MEKIKSNQHNLQKKLVLNEKINFKLDANEFGPNSNNYIVF